MESKTLRFTAQVSANVESYKSLPIFDEHQNILLGGFSVLSGDKIVGFISGQGNPFALMLEINEPFYFTPKINKAGLVESAIISELPISSASEKVFCVRGVEYGYEERQNNDRN